MLWDYNGEHRLTFTIKWYHTLTVSHILLYMYICKCFASSQCALNCIFHFQGGDASNHDGRPWETGPGPWWVKRGLRTFWFPCWRTPEGGWTPQEDAGNKSNFSFDRSQRKWIVLSYSRVKYAVASTFFFFLMVVPNCNPGIFSLAPWCAFVFVF